MWEAIGPKTETQGVLIIQNDSIVYEKCTGEMAVDKIAGVFSVTKSVTSLLCGMNPRHSSHTTARSITRPTLSGGWP